MTKHNYSISKISQDFMAQGQRMTSTRIKAIRSYFKLSQSKFADYIGMNVRTLQNWECESRRPCGPAVALLYLAETQPEVFIKNRKKLLEQVKQLSLML